MPNRSKDDYKDENAQLKKRIRELEKALKYSRLETLARDMMIDKAEEYFDIWGQIATELVGKRGMKVALACRLFGHCRQAFYQAKADIEKDVEHERRIIDAVREIRSEDPRIGGYKLWLMLISLFGRDYMPGRDRFFVIMR